jgi:N,N'-diacetyllegionaminate synthase
MQNKKIIGIIPARGGSKGIPKKNIKKIAGKPLICWTIEEAKKSKLLDDFYVSTEDGKISEISKKAGAKIIQRPSEFSTDEADQMDAIKHALEAIGGEIGVILQPTSPVKNKDRIDECIKEFLEKNADSLATGFGCDLFEWGTYNQNRQNLQTFFHDDGNIKILTKDLIKRKERIGKNPIKKIIDREENVQIDNEFDFWVVEKILEKRKEDKIKIGERIFEKEKPVFIIAEAGVNHNGNIEIAKKMIDSAKDAGVDAIKFQTYKTEELVTNYAEKSDYQGEGTQFETLKKLELSEEEFFDLKKYCDQKEILFFSTPHTESSVDFLDEIVPAYKIASGDLTNFPLLKKIAEKQKPMILSTGMATMEEIKETLNYLKKTNKKIILLHCTTSYPCPRENVNLRAMGTIENETGCITGYSDHTLGIDVSLMAVKKGAKIIEKHFTLDKNLDGPDHKASLEPLELKEMVDKIRNKDFPEYDETVLGSCEKKPSEEELKILPTSRKSIVAKNYILKGTILTKDMLSIKRPGTGIPPKEIENLIGRKVKEDIKEDEKISFEKIEKEGEGVKIIRSAVGSMPSMGIINELKKEGVEVIGIDSDPSAFGFRKLDKSYVVPLGKSENFLEEILKIIEKENPNAILSGPEEETLVLSKNKKTLEEKGVVVLCPDYESVEICSDKIKTHEKFIAMEIPVPKLFNNLEEVIFPCIIKPQFGRGSEGIYIANNQEELKFYLKISKEQVIVQEFVEGKEYTIDVLTDKEGNAISIVPRLRLDTESGISVKGRTIYDKEIIEYCKKIARELKLFGGSCIQCIKNEKEIKFIEVNTRFGGGSILSLKADPTIIPNLIKLIKKEEITPSESFKEGLTMLRYYSELIEEGK